MYKSERQEGRNRRVRLQTRCVHIPSRAIKYQQMTHPYALNVTIQFADDPGTLSEAAAPQIRNPARAPSLFIATPIRDTPPCRSTVEGREDEEDNRAVLHPWLQGE
jgi:hypothetical protein